MIKVINKLFILYFFWICFQVYEKIEEHNQRIEGIEGQLPVIQRKIDKIKKEKKLLKSYLKDVEKKKAEIEEVAQEVEKLQKQLPAKVSDADNLSYIRSIATNLKFKNINLRPDSERDEGFYITKKYILEGQTTYLQFLLFLEKISLSEQLLNIRGIELARGPETRSKRYEIIKVKANVEAYQYNSNYKEDRGIDNIDNMLQKKAEEEKTKTKQNKRKRRRRRR